MSARRLLILIGLAGLALAGSLWLGARRGVPADAGLAAPVLPGLADRLDAVTGLKLAGGGHRTLVTLTRTSGHWQVQESASYPADEARVRRLLIGLAELRVLEAKTSDAANFAALGVEDVAAAQAQSLELTLTGVEAPRVLLVGRTAGTQGIYVRVAGAARALEVRPVLDVARAPHDWLARSVLDVAPERVESAQITRADGPQWLAERAVRGAADSVSSVLAALELEDVRPAGPAAADRPHRALVRCYDGLVVSLEGRTAGDERWLRIAARFDAALAAHFATADAKPLPAAASVSAESERITTLTRGWEYRLPRYRFEAIFRPRAELLRR